MKLVMVLGVCGSGKGFIADRIVEPKAVIRIDLVRRRILESLDPQLLTELARDLDPDWMNRWNIWRKLFEKRDLSLSLEEHFRNAVLEECPIVDTAEVIVAEGGLLAFSPFRQMFVGAINQIAQNMEGLQIAWIDPSDEQVLENRRTRGRRSDVEATINTVQREKRHYSQHAEEVCPVRYVDATSAISGIDSFLKSS